MICDISIVYVVMQNYRALDICHDLLIQISAKQHQARKRCSGELLTCKHWHIIKFIPKAFKCCTLTSLDLTDTVTRKSGWFLPPLMWHTFRGKNWTANHTGESDSIVAHVDVLLHLTNSLNIDLPHLQRHLIMHKNDISHSSPCIYFHSETSARIQSFEI